MGAWGTGSFENDQALDWVADLVETRDLSLVTEALRPLAPGEQLDASVGTDFVSAGELVAALLGAPAADLPAELREWVARHRGLDATALRAAALAGLEQVLSSESELKQLWEENEELYPEWRQRILELEARLRT